MKDKGKHKSPLRRLQAGNAIVMLFAALGVAGTIGYSLNNIMRGPALTTAELSRKTIADNNIMAATRLAVASATKTQANRGDCDQDGFVEPLPYRDAGALPKPTGGGLLPMTMGASQTDPWGVQYGYCVWDSGTQKVSDNIAGCGGNTALRLNGAPKDNHPVLAVISAGPNGAFETSCNAYVDTTPADGIPDTVMINRPGTSDDIVQSFTYAEANGIGAGEWKIKTGDTTTAQIAKDLDVQGGASFTGALNTSQGGLVLPKDPGDNSVTGACDASRDQQMRLNMSSDPPNMEICNVGGTGWTVVSGGTGGAGDPTCTFATPQLMKRIAGGYHDGVFKDGYFYGYTNSGGSACTITWADAYNPANPTYMSSTTNCTRFATDGVLIRNGNYLYTANRNDNSLSVFEVTTSAPVYRGKVTNATSLNVAMHLAALNSQYVVVTAAGTDRVTVVDVSTPTAPAVANAGAASVQDATWLNNPNDIIIAGNYAYVAAKDARALTAVNLTNPLVPTVGGNATAPGLDLYGLSNLAIRDNYIYGITWESGNPYIATFDISTPGSPSYVGRKTFTSLNAAKEDIAIYGKYLFIATQAPSLVVFDLSDPEDPIELHNFPMFNQIYGLEMKENYLYASGYDYSVPHGGTQVFNMGCNPHTGEVDSSAFPGEPVADPIPDRLDTGMIAHWKMDEGTGTSVADSVGTYTGTFSNTPIWKSGPNGASSLLFAEADSDSVTVTGLLGQPGVGSVAAWVNIRRHDSSGTSHIFSIGDYVYLESGSGNTGLGFSYWDGGTIRTVASNKDISGTGWRYIVATWDQTGNLFNLYLDGALVSTGTWANDITWTGRGANTHIGRHGNAGTTQFLDGSVDDIRVYSRALSPSEIDTLYNRAKTGSQARAINGVEASHTYASEKISAGFYSTCGIKTDGTLWCWGDDAFLQLGNGTLETADQASPVRVGTLQGIAKQETFTQVSTGYRFACAIRNDGTLWCWGHNGAGQLGTGACCTNGASPTQVTGGNLWTQVSAGDSHVCAIRVNGTLWCWGSDTYGELGNGATAGAQSTPNQVAGRWTSVSAGQTHTCAINTDGELWCWGRDQAGQLGNGSVVTSDQISPVLVAETGPWASVSAGQIQTCGVKTDGSGWCWGTERNGNLGNGPQITAQQDSPYPVGGGVQSWSTIKTNGTSSCGIKANGTLWCWGSDTYGEQGNGATTGDIAWPRPIAGSSSWSGLSLGLDHACAIRAEEGAFCWGRDADLQLGNGALVTADQTTPVPVENFAPFAIFGWDDTYSAITGPVGYNYALGSNFLTPSTSANAEGFGFTGPGIANLIAPSTATQFQISTTSTTASTQTSFMTDSTLPADVTTGLVGQWNLDEISGAAVPASVGSAGTTFNGAVWTPTSGRGSGALHLDRVQNQYVRIPRYAGLEGTAVTLSFWLRPIGEQVDFAAVVHKTWNDDAGPTHSSYAFQLFNDGQYSFNTSYTAAEDEMFSTTVIPNDKWTHVVATYDPASAAPQKRVYINGQLDLFKTITNAMIHDATATGDLYFGATSATQPRYTGLIDNVRIYNRAITQAEAQTIFMRESAGMQTPRTMGVDYTTNNFEIGRTNATATNWLDAISPDLTVTATGTVGIGTASPAAAVDVAGSVRIGADHVCSTAADAGKIRYIPTASTRWQFCDGTSWTGLPAAAPSYYKKSRYALTPGWGFSDAGRVCGIGASGKAYCWGDADNRGLGNNQFSVDSLIPTEVHSDTSSVGWSDWVQLAGIESVCGLRSNGEIWCWGYGWNGRLGNGEDTEKLRPTRVQTDTGPGAWNDWIQVAGWMDKMCGLRSNGTAWCWGIGREGMLGNNTTTGYETTRPVQVHSDVSATGWTDWVELSGGWANTCGRRRNGTVWCWGNAADYQLGNGSTTEARRPVQVQTDTGPGGWSDWTQISYADGYGCGLRTDGSAWCWGSASAWHARFGHSCSGTSAGRPNRVKTDTGAAGWNDWVLISAGRDATCGIRSNGTLWCWGYQTASGQLGNNSTTNSCLPVQVHSDVSSTGWTDWRSVVVGRAQTCGVRADGSAWCWGKQEAGQLGNGVDSLSLILRPTRVLATMP